MAEIQLFSMAEVAAKLRKSTRWLYYYLKANPHGRFVGRSRMFTEGDLAKLINSLPMDKHAASLPLPKRRVGPRSAAKSTKFQELLDRLPNHTPRSIRRRKPS